MKTILIILQLTFATFASAQVVPWNYTNTGIVHSINISSANISVDDSPLRAGDAVGVFYDSLGKLVCAGYSILPSNEILAYGDNTGSANRNGFVWGEPFQFKIWRKQTNCLVDSGTIIQFQSEPPMFNDSIYFRMAGSSSKMITLHGVTKKIQYAKTNYCIGDLNPLPVKVGTILTPLVYSSQSGLSINPSTGLINIAASVAGSYQVYFSTPSCLSSTSFPITIKMNLDNLSMQLTKSTCTEKGSIQIDANSIICGTAPYEYRLRNILTGQENTFTTSLLSEVSDASYELFIKDANGEEVKWKNIVTMTKECKDLIIAPNSNNGQAMSYYIPYQGIARIYDRFGLLKKELSIPADWDATDHTGNQVAMGQYVIICNEDQHIVVTVVK